jgi:lysozyme
MRFAGAALRNRYADGASLPGEGKLLAALGMIGDALRPFKVRMAGLSVVALAAALTGCGGGTGPIEMVDRGSYPKPRDYPVHGIDVSKFQGNIDWNAVADSGVKFAWIKATEGGDHADERFQANWNGAKAAGIPHGAYHFVYWCRPPLEEINWFEQNAPVEDDALPPVLDVEATPTSKTCHRHLTQAGAVADMRVMLQEMERHYGKRPIIYTTVDFYEAILVDGALSDYPIWVRSTKYHPAVKYGSRAWQFWQYQSDGQTPGIGVNVDRDVFYGTKEQWDAFLREPQSGPNRPTVEKAFTQQVDAAAAAASEPPPAPADAQPAPQPDAQQAAAPQQTDDQAPSAQQ